VWQQSARMGPKSATPLTLATRGGATAAPVAVAESATVRRRTYDPASAATSRTATAWAAGSRAPLARTSASSSS